MKSLLFTLFLLIFGFLPKKTCFLGSDMNCLAAMNIRQAVRQWQWCFWCVVWWRSP